MAQLTARQQAAYALFAQGLAAPEVAQRLGISRPAALERVRQAEKRLGARLQRRARNGRGDPGRPVRDFDVPAAALAKTRAKTIASRVTRAERAARLPVDGHPELPANRDDCDWKERGACPMVSCSHHLYLDVNPATGAIKLNFPHLEVWELKETCSLDVADRGGATLEQVAAAFNLTRERIRQIEVRALVKLRMGRAR